jgi:hypothetical protein
MALANLYPTYISRAALRFPAGSRLFSLPVTPV